MFISKGQLTVAAALISSMVSGNISPAIASESPFQDFLKYKQIVDGSGDPSELSPYVLPTYRAKFDAKSEVEKQEYCRGIRSFYNMQNIKLRSESKNGNDATVIFDCQGMATAEVGSTMLLQPLVVIVNMVKTDGNWSASNISEKRPKEFAAMGATTASSMDADKAWCSAGHKVATPNKPLSGILQGSPFTLTRADFTSFTNQSTLGLHIADSAKFKNLVLFVSLDTKPNPLTTSVYTEKRGVKQIQFAGKIDDKDSTLFFDRNSGFVITMQKLPLKDGKYPLYILMRLPDGKHTELKGYCYADAIGK